MTPPIGVVYVYRQQRASCAAKLQLLLKAMGSHAFPISFNSMTGVRSVGDLRIGICPKNGALKYSLARQQIKTDLRAKPHDQKRNLNGLQENNSA